MPQKSLEESERNVTRFYRPWPDEGLGNSKPFRLRSAADLVASPPSVVWTVGGILERDIIALLFGESGSSKSFIALDIALSVATGMDWHGAPTTQGPVVYIAGEGHAGLARRVKAWTIGHERNDLAGVPFYANEGAIQLANPVAMQEVRTSIEALSDELGAPLALIVVDTLARNFGPADENSTKDMGVVVNHIDEHLRRPYGTTVLVLHHSGHAARDRARGAYALKAAVDVELQVERRDGLVSLRGLKSKEAEVEPLQHFEPRTVELPWKDAEEEPLTSLVLVAADGPSEQGDTTTMSKRQRDALNVLNTMYGEAEEILLAQSRDPSEALIEVNAWRDACYAHGIFEGKHRRYSWRDVRQALHDRHLVRIEGVHAIPL